MSMDAFTMAPDFLVRQYGPVRALVYGRVWRYCQMDQGVCFRPVDGLADDLGIDRTSLMRHLKALVADGFIEDTTPGLRNRPHAYKVTGKLAELAQIGVAESDPAVAKSDLKIVIKKESNKPPKIQEQEEGLPKTLFPTPQKTAAAAAARNQYFTNAAEGQAHHLLLQASGLAAVPNDEIPRIDSVVALITAYGQEKCLEALVEARKEWVRTPKKTGGGGNYSVLNFAWVDWASELLATGVKRWEENKKGKNNGNSNHTAGDKKPAFTEQQLEQARRVSARERERLQASAGT